MSARKELDLPNANIALGRGDAEHSSEATSDGLLPFAALACATTWLLSLPLVSSWMRGVPPAPFMLALAGLGAFGPTFAAFVVARRQRRLREVFGHFEAQPLWLVAALFAPLCLHLVARLGEHALGGDVTRWFWLPQTPAQVTALVFFSVGEEFGWRGFAHPRLFDRYGAVLGPLLTGLIWGVWHLFYAVNPQGSIDLPGFTLMLVELLLWSPIIAWFFERTQRSISVAISIHAGAHLDNASQIPADHWRMRLLVLLVVAVAAVFAARSLRAIWGTRSAGAST